MSLIAEIPMILKEYKKHAGHLAHNTELFNIFEGDLLTYVLDALREDLSAESFKQAVSRATPINVLRRLMDKLSKIYEKPPVRKVEDGSKSDEELLSEYETALDINTVMGGADGANHLFNLHKGVWIEPFIDEGTPKLRAVPADRFFVIGADRANPTKPTHFVKVMGTVASPEEGEQDRTLFHAYTADEFVIFDDKETVRFDMMAELEIDGTSNPIQALPGVYINRSKYRVMPKRDTDTLAMTKLIPIWLTDLGYALKFQVFSLLYTIDCDQTDLKMAPNALWDLKSKPSNLGGDAKPTVGVVKPEVDSDKALNMIKSIFTLWMETRNIKPGNMGQVSGDNVASGVAKIIDEADTSGDRQAQVPFFKSAEEQLFALIKDKYHPYWSAQPDFKLKGMSFTPNCRITCTFAEQRPNIDPAVAVDNQVKKLDAGLQSRKGALKELYPDWTDTQIEEKLAEIDEEAKERQAKAQEMAAAMGNQATDGQAADQGKEDWQVKEPAKVAEPVA